MQITERQFARQGVAGAMALLVGGIAGRDPALADAP